MAGMVEGSVESGRDGSAQGATVAVGTGPLTIDDVVAVARDDAPVALADDAREAIARARAVVEALAAAPTPAYGVSTGFGALGDGTSPPRCAPSCSARSCARTPPARAPRSSARSCAA